MDVQPCPVCASRAWSPTGLVNAYGMGADVVSCDDCGVRFYTRELYPTDDQLVGPQWEAMAEATVSCGSLGNRDEAQADRFRSAVATYYDGLIDRLASVAAPGSLSTLFDVGAHVGTFLSVAAGRGIEAEGCDVDLAGARMAGRTYGVHVTPWAFQVVAVPRERDAITMLDYIEHTFTPRQDIERAFQRLRPGGALLLKTFYEEWHDGRVIDLSPDTVSMSGDEGLARRGYYSLGHRCHWTTDALLSLVRRCGFDVVDTEHDTHYGQVTIWGRRPA